ncbi:MAG: aminoacyl-histidine dipeptidase [Thermomicrobiales bacterium]
MLQRLTTGRASRRRVAGAFLGQTGLIFAGLAGCRAAAQATPISATPAAPVQGVPLDEAVAGLAPPAVWEHFLQLTQIPRPSHHEEQVSTFLADFGRGLGLETAADVAGNVLIRKSASPGKADRPGVILQAHMDMVPAKTSDSDHDFGTDPIEAFVEDGWVRADRTTLGADDGIGVALIMALLEDDTIVHGPLEALFTVDEEDGFDGVNALQPGVLQGSFLINVDSEEEGVFTIGCAGGVDVDASADYEEEATPSGMTGIQLAITGLQGGHSGVDINRGRGNAIKLLARLLWNAQEAVTLRVTSITGGERNNAIPRDAVAVVAVPEGDATALIALVETVAATILAELATAEPQLAITAMPANLPGRVMSADAQHRIIEALYGSPNGVMRMSDAVPGLVETSTNLGTVSATSGRLAAGFRVRSAVDSARDDVAQMITSVWALADVETTTYDAYPGWRPDPDSPLLGLMQMVYQGLYGREAKIMAVHAGLETSVIGATYPALDMISIGPTIQDVHSPHEQLEISSVSKVYDLLVATLERIAA